MNRRLHLQIFGALLITGLSCVGLALFVLSFWGGGIRRDQERAEDIAAIVIEELPRPDQAGFRRALRRRARSLHAAISIWDEDGRLSGSAGRPLRPPVGDPPTRARHDRHDGSFWFPLDDGQSVAVALRPSRARGGPDRTLIGFLLLFVVLLLGSYVAARRITRRLTALTDGVMRFGEGALDTRVEVRGADEIARLAEAFNRSFARISGLLRQQRRMLQSASHELRSPLARLRMAVELLGESQIELEARAQMVASAERDIADLDELIADLLLAGRLADSELPRDFVPVDFCALLQSEADRAGVEVEAQPAQLSGNPRMLRSLVRNLLENARRHGAEPIRARLLVGDGQVVLRVEDHGGGIPPEAAARIFEPFYRPQGHSEGRDGGVGLGLALVKDIAEHHAGTVRYLRDGDVSRFEVTLPRA